MSNNAHELSNRLLNALDNNYNVVDMHTVNEIISVLERINITKELLETTRLGKHVNELRRKTADPTLARRAKVLVKRWRDLVIPTVASPGQTGSNRSSAERTTVRARLGGTPLTSPALSRQVVSPAVNSPRPPSRPAWGGYESDSQDVILVDDEPSPAPAPSPAPVHPQASTSSTAVPSTSVNSHGPSTSTSSHGPSTLANSHASSTFVNSHGPSIFANSHGPSTSASSHAPSIFANSHGPSTSAHSHKPLTPPVNRPPSTEPLFDDKKAKRDKKPKKKRGHSRAGSGTEATGPVAPAASAAPAAQAGPAGSSGAPASAWAGRNGTTHDRRRNGTKREAMDSYAALVNRMPPAGAKKVKTTKELLEQIQSRGSRAAASPAPASPPSPQEPASPDVMLIEPDTVVKVDSPLRNGGVTPRSPSPAASPPPPMSPLEEPREYLACTCGEEADAACPAAEQRVVLPRHVHALHNAYVPGVNGTRAPALPHRFAVRPAEDPERPGLFNSVVPLYKYSDYADDYCVKNMSQVQLCSHLPWTSFAPPPPDLPPPPEPPPLRPYPEPEPEPVERDEDADESDVKPEIKREPVVKEEIEVEAEMVGVPTLEPSERLKAPILMPEDETSFGVAARAAAAAVESHATAAPQHRSVPRTKEQPGGAALVAAVRAASDAVPHSYSQLQCATVLPRAAMLSDNVLSDALSSAASVRDPLGRPARGPATKFAEWHECATLGELIALPYVVID